MSDERPDVPSELDRLLRPEVVPMPILEGRYEAILAEAARRRRHSWWVVAASAAAVLVVVLGGLAVVARPDDAPPAASRPALTSSRAASPNGSPSPTPPGATATPSASVLPAGGPVPRGFVPVSVSTASADVVFALGDAPCAAPPCTSLVRSADRGRTWVGVPAPRASYEDGHDGMLYKDAVSQVRFANARDGWVFASALWVTHDGAASADSWRHLAVDGRVLDLATDGTTVWIVVGSGCSDGGCTGATLRRADVGDDRFTTVDGVGGAFPLDSAQLGVTRDSVSVLLRARTATDVVAPVAWISTGGGAFRRVDGAAACTSPDTTGSSSLDLLQPAAKDGALVALCSDGGAAGSTYLHASSSSDGGATWRQARGALRLTNGLSRTLAPVSRQLLVAASGGLDDTGGLVQVSRDGGASWHEARVPRPAAGWRYLGAAGGQRVIGLVYGQAALWMSGNAGATWSRYPIR